MHIITPPVIVLIAFLWQPLRHAEKSIYMVEWETSRAWSMRPVPIMLPDGRAANLTSEIGPGSVVRLSLTDYAEHLIVKAVELIEHRLINPFQMAG